MVVLTQFACRAARRLSPARALGLCAASLGVGLAQLDTASAGPAAGPVDCASVLAPGHRAAIDTAEAWFSGHWLHAGHTWTSLYHLKPAPALPLGMAAFKGAAALTEVGSGGATAPIDGIAEIASVGCTTYETSPEHAYVVRFTGHALTFNENAGGWSRPLPAALIHILDVRPAAGAAPRVTPVADARTALPPDAELSLPAASDMASLKAPKHHR